MSEGMSCKQHGAAYVNPRFRLHVVSAAIAILWLAARLFFVYAKSRRPDADVGACIGTGIGQFLCVGLVYLLAWGLFRAVGRSNFIANLLFCLILLGTIGAGLGR